MEPGTTNAMKHTRYGFGNLFRPSRLAIGTRLTACFVAIVLLMIAADVVVFWQLRRMVAPTRHLSSADQTSLAIVRVHLDVDAFRDRAGELESSHDTRLFASEVVSLRSTFLQDVEHAKQALTLSPDLEQDPTISSALETLAVALPSQLDTALALATTGDWNAVSLRLAQQSQDPIHLSSLLVERLNQQLLQQRAKAIESTQQARRQLIIAVPIAALLTLLAAVILGWYVTRTITVPLSELAAGAHALARGDFQPQMQVGGNDELTVLAKAFNYATRRLNELYEGLRRSEKQLRDVINTVPAYMWSASAEGVVDFVNQGWQEFTGLPPEGGLGRNWESLLHPDDRAKFVAEWGAALRNGQSVEGEARVLRADGEYRWWFCRNVPLRDETGNIVKWFGTGVDIEDRKRAEEERERLRQAQADLAYINRVSTMGELTASLAHEINQPIGAAVTNAQACLRFLNRDRPDMPEAREAALEMVRDASRAADIIDRVRSLYRKGSPHQEMVDVNEVIREMVVMLRNEANRHSVTMRTGLDETGFQVMADRVQLQQVLMNLMMNGIEAMRDGGGELSIKSQLDDDGQLLISVSDTGIGLPIGKTDEIFNAFFTTKSQGTGLGLAITRSIVEAYGGRVWATGNSPTGATFGFTLPLKKAAHA